MTRLRSYAATARQARLRSSSFGPWTSSGPFRATSRDAEARNVATLRVRRIRTAVTTVVGVMIGGTSSVLACPMCFGAEETSMIDGTKLGILLLLAITFAVQGGFVGFFFYLRKRAKRIADLDLDAEWSELQGSPRTS